VRKVITIDFLLWNYYYEYNLMEKLERLKKKITQRGNLLVAFSGGVDSGLLLKVAPDALEDKVLAVR
jgi:PP-loop superfamily ATP-utilizing enzyme